MVLRSPLDLQIVFEGEIRGGNDESMGRVETAPYSCQEGPSFPLTSAYTLATDFVGVLPIADGLTILAVTVSERGRGGRWATNQISDNGRNGNAALSHIQVVDLHASTLAKTYPISRCSAVPLLGQEGHSRYHQRTMPP